MTLRSPSAETILEPHSIVSPVETPFFHAGGINYIDIIRHEVSLCPILLINAACAILRMMQCVMDGVGMVNDGYLFEFLSKDGYLFKVRPLMPEDAHYLVDLFDHMGPESRFLRFNVALTNPDRDLVWAEARRLANVDPEKDGAWLVFADSQDQTGAPVGGVRYIRIDEHTAEASLVVRDDHQNKGIGTVLLKFLIEQARQAGLQKLIATVQRSNRRIFHLLLQSDLRLEFDSEGGYTLITAHLE